MHRILSPRGMRALQRRGRFVIASSDRRLHRGRHKSEWQGLRWNAKERRGQLLTRKFYAPETRRGHLRLTAMAPKDQRRTGQQDPCFPRTVGEGLRRQRSGVRVWLMNGQRRIPASGQMRRALEEIGGEPLEGSGFEAEVPEEGFTADVAPAAPHAPGESAARKNPGQGPR